MTANTADVRLIRVQPRFQQAKAREPLKFGASVVEGATYCLVEVEVETRGGARGVGHGAMLLSDFWAFPEPRVSHEVREKAMMALSERFCRLAAGYTGQGHPVDVYMELEADLARLAAGVSEEFGLAAPLPTLAALVCASPVDAALHDAYGIANRMSSYSACGPDLAGYDLSRYLGTDFKGRYVSDYVRAEAPGHLDVFHLVGGLDTLWEKDVRPGANSDGLPNSLEGWIERDGLRCLKVKLRGTDLGWDLDRLERVHAVARAVHDRLGIGELCLSIDTNEQCESPRYIVELLLKLKERRAAAYDSILYVEQPTERDLRKSRHDMCAVAALRPVIIDESLTSLEELNLALELNWSGLALKTCKGHTGALLFAALARHRGILCTFQDLSNPGISLVHSAGLAGRLETLRGFEANSCQYFPQANTNAAAVHPGVFRRRDGRVCLESIRGPGLGLRWDEIGAQVA